MEDKRLSAALSRHPRPQALSISADDTVMPMPRVPTKAALLARRSTSAGPPVPSWIPRSHSSRSTSSHVPLQAKRLKLQPNPPPNGYIRLGTLVQGAHEVVVCTSDWRDLCAVKIVRGMDLKLPDNYSALSHPNIVAIEAAYKIEGSIYLKMDYSRYTLEEAVSTRVLIDEPHIRAVAQSLFKAICHLASRRLLHGRINLDYIRFAPHTSQILLDGWEQSTPFTKDETPQSDLEGLCMVLLRCMDGKSYSNSLTIERAREQRARNKVFGLESAERWSAYKQLVDMLDDLLSMDRTCWQKIKSPHPYLVQNIIEPTVFSPVLEIASLEGFTLWEIEQKGRKLYLPEPNRIEG